jgi:hypothetical protein
MTIAPQTPPPTRSEPDDEIDAGVIKDARERQRRHRGSAAALATCVILAAAIIGFFGGGGTGSGANGGGHRPRPEPGGSHAQSGKPLRDAPVSQAHGNWTASAACPVAPPSRYLPPWSGCVTVRRVDLTGAGRPDLVVLYSRLSHTHFISPGAHGSMLRDEIGRQAVLRVITAHGLTVSTTLVGVRAATVIAITHIGALPGKQIIIQTSELSSGSNAEIFSLDHDRLTPAGVTLAYGGDSRVQAGFDCLGSPARLVQRVFVPLGNLLTAPWRETETTFVWRHARLVRLAARTVEHNGEPAHSQTSVGAGCLRGVNRAV